MKKIMRGLLVMVGIILPALSQADDRSYGCGFGSQVAPRKTLISTTTAGVIDALSMPTRAFAITSGTSGCAQHDLVKNEFVKEHFIAANFETLKFESALGQGEHLAALGQFYGCPDNLRPQFASHMKRNFSQLFSQSNAKAISLEIKNRMYQDHSLVGCVL